MTSDCNHIYLNRVPKVVGNMLHNAVEGYGYDGCDFLYKFIQSDIAEQIENENPKYVAGKSGSEIFIEVVERTSGKQIDFDMIESYDRSAVYWVGWMLAHYHYYSGRSFRDILEVISYDEMLGLYATLHEADVQKAYEVLDKHFTNVESKLKSVRKRCGMTQEELSKQSGVSLNTIRAYERGAKDIGKAQVNIVMSLAKVLKCDVGDIVG